MRILFLTTSLEPGRDGVGDYVRLLTNACVARGHACSVVALQDSFVAEPVDFMLETTGASIPAMRLPATWSWERRLERAAKLRDQFHPDRISFQVVPYALERHGILSPLVASLRQLTSDCPLHLMFHELWLGAGRPSPFRFYILGWFQRQGVRRLLTHLQPKLVTTSNPVYAAMLRSLEVPADILPLFGNIPIAATDLPSAFSELPSEAGIVGPDRQDWWIGVFFGALHEQWHPEPFMSRLLRAARRAGKRICLLLVGRAGIQGELIWNLLQRDYAAHVTFVHMGESTTDAVSNLLQLADFGIAASPWQLIGKSGTVAAMLDHGLPVIVTRDDFQPFFRTDEPPSADLLVHLDNAELEAKMVEGLPKRPPRARVDEIAAQLCHRLENLPRFSP